MPTASGRPAGEQFARLAHGRLVGLVRAMPDAQSAVLACLVWSAARQELLAHGPWAGQFVARASGPRLASLTGRPLRTVRHALRRLTQAGRIRRVTPIAGHTAVYALDLPMS
jgi:hypothetical protein